MNYGSAVDAMKQGHCVARAGWKGKGMHIFLVDPFYVALSVAGRVLPVRRYESVICMWTSEYTTQPGWLASPADMLANDWCIVDMHDQQGGKG